MTTATSILLDSVVVVGMGDASFIREQRNYERR